MQFAEFAARADEVEAEPADLEVVSLVASLLSAAGDDLPTVARFVQGRVFPAWRSETLDIGPRLCHEALARAAGPNVSADDVEARLAETGEIGAVAASYDFGGQRGLAAFGGGANGDETGASGDLSVAEVDRELRALAATTGAGSERRKLDALFGLFNRCSPPEARYLARLVLSEMRIGVGEGSVRDAVAEAFDVPVESVGRALQVTNDYGRVAELARDEGEEGLDGVGLSVGRPVQAMLAQAGTAEGALEEWGTAAVETKFDGARVQVHYDGEEVRLFSRNMEEVTDALPEIAEFVEENARGPCILDGEAVAVDDAGDPLPFQEVLRRFRRKHDVDRMREEVTLRLDAFDCLRAGGEDLLDAPLRERRERLTDVLDGGVEEVRYADEAAAVEAFEEAALEAGHEGIMLKNPESTYSPGDRGKNWLKRKPDVETLDLVVTGAEWGEGRRAKQLGTFLLSVRNGDDYETVGKVATGITDEKLAELTDLLEPLVASEEGTELTIRPEVVFEVGYEEIQRSPTYSSGFALRFPRFRSVRSDKGVEDADTLERVERLADEQ